MRAESYKRIWPSIGAPHAYMRICELEADGSRDQWHCLGLAIEACLQNKSPVCHMACSQTVQERTLAQPAGCAFILDLQLVITSCNNNIGACMQQHATHNDSTYIYIDIDLSVQSLKCSQPRDTYPDLLYASLQTDLQTQLGHI